MDPLGYSCSRCFFPLRCIYNWLDPQVERPESITSLLPDQQTWSSESDSEQGCYVSWLYSRAYAIYQQRR
ncbi:uncharacterized protein K441DRAFT_668101, partial [Cenococcum geophilum 1.58]|uniref:uncharacterized protein n=1 Tax=Cenococcum geophilum 1.58 TaxID=794803 RepID=UPI00358F5C2A